MVQTYGIQDLKRDFRQLADTDDVTRELFLVEAYKFWTGKIDINGLPVYVGPVRADVAASIELYKGIACEDFFHANPEPLERAVLAHFKRCTKERCDKLIRGAKQNLWDVMHETVYDTKGSPHKLLQPYILQQVGLNALSFYFGPKRAKGILAKAEKMKQKN